MYDSVSYEETFSVEKSFKDTSLIEISQTNQDNGSAVQSANIVTNRKKSADDGKADYYQLSPNHVKEPEGMMLYFSMHDASCWFLHQSQI